MEAVVVLVAEVAAWEGSKLDGNRNSKVSRHHRGEGPPGAVVLLALPWECYVEVVLASMLRPAVVVAVVAEIATMQLQRMTLQLPHLRRLPPPVRHPHLSYGMKSQSPSIEAKKAQLSSIMGLLPEANLVWLSADEKLFLWSYQATSTAFSPSFLNNVPSPLTTTTTTPTITDRGLSQNSNDDKQDYCTFTVPSGQCIVSVGLVRPKPGVFHPTTVEWCVVVTTPEEVILCALAKEDLNLNLNDLNLDEEDDGMVMNGGRGKGGRTRYGRSSSLLRLIPTRYVLPTDSIPIMSIAGTSGGRIFLGGYDGNLYEMMYEGQQRHSRKYQSSSCISDGNLNGSGSNEALEVAIDDYFDGEGVFTLNTGGENTKNIDSLLSFSGALLGGKRVLSALTFGSLYDDDDTFGDSITNGIHSQKCRKINHSSTASSLVTSVVPGAIIRVASGIFGSSMHAVAKDAGPIVNMVVDEERSCLYTLGAKGIICSYDILPLSNTFERSGKVGGTSNFTSNNAPRLASVFDSIASAKLYLDSVSRGRMYPPSTSQNIRLGTITFPGGEASAQAGVGGMEGAREILKRHEWEGRAMKAATSSLGSAGAGMRGLRDRMIFCHCQTRSNAVERLVAHLLSLATVLLD